MKTTITLQEAEILTDILAAPKEFAEFVGVSVNSDILEMTPEELAADGSITVEQAETILLAASLSDEPSIWGAYQIINDVMDSDEDLV